MLTVRAASLVATHYSAIRFNYILNNTLVQYLSDVLQAIVCRLVGAKVTNLIEYCYLGLIRIAFRIVS